MTSGNTHICWKTVGMTRLFIRSLTKVTVSIPMTPRTLAGMVRRLVWMVVKPRFFSVRVIYCCGGLVGTRGIEICGLVSNRRHPRAEGHVLPKVRPKIYRGHNCQSHNDQNIIFIESPWRLCISDFVGSSRRTLCGIVSRPLRISHSAGRQGRTDLLTTIISSLLVVAIQHV